MKTLLLIALASLTCSAASAKGRQISIHLYNLSGIPAHTLDPATREVSRIFAQQDVTIDWTAGAPEAEQVHTADPDGPAAFRDAHVRPFLVVRVGRGLAFKVPNGVLGVSRPHAQFGISATIFQDRIEALGQDVGLDFALLLGYAIAHEIGHGRFGRSPDNLFFHAFFGILADGFNRSKKYVEQNGATRNIQYEQRHVVSFTRFRHSAIPASHFRDRPR